MMTMIAVVVGVLGIKGGEMPSNGGDFSGKDKVSKDSNNDIDGGSGGVVRDKRGDSAKQWRRVEHQRQDEQGYDDDGNGGSGGGVRDERGDNAKQSRRSEQQQQDEQG